MHHSWRQLRTTCDVWLSNWLSGAAGRGNGRWPRHVIERGPIASNEAKAKFLAPPASSNISDAPASIMGICAQLCGNFRLKRLQRHFRKPIPRIFRGHGRPNFVYLREKFAAAPFWQPIRQPGEIKSALQVASDRFYKGFGRRATAFDRFLSPV